jgi:hypothetical protein
MANTIVSARHDFKANSVSKLERECKSKAVENIEEECNEQPAYGAKAILSARSGSISRYTHLRITTAARFDIQTGPHVQMTRG